MKVFLALLVVVAVAAAAVTFDEKPKSTEKFVVSPVVSVDDQTREFVKPVEKAATELHEDAVVGRTFFNKPQLGHKKPGTGNHNTGNSNNAHKTG